MAVERILLELQRRVLTKKQEAIDNLDKLDKLSENEKQLMELRRRLKEIGLDLPVDEAVKLLSGALPPVPREEIRKVETPEEERLILNPQKNEIYRGLRRVTGGKRMFELVSYLVKREGQPVSVKELTEVYFPGGAPRAKSQVGIKLLRFQQALEPDIKRPKYLTRPGEGLWLLQTKPAIEEVKAKKPALPSKERAPEEKLYTIPQASREVGLSPFSIGSWAKGGKLLQEGKHFIVIGGKERPQRRITEEGINRLKLIKARKGERRREEKTLLREIERVEKGKIEGKKELPPGRIKFIEEEKVKLAGCLTKKAEWLKNTFDFTVSPAIKVIWDSACTGAFEIKDPKAVVSNLEQKLRILAQNPSKHYPRFADNEPVQEVLQLMEKFATIEKRREFLEAVLHPQPLEVTQLAFDQPVERINRH